MPATINYGYLTPDDCAALDVAPTVDARDDRGIGAVYGTPMLLPALTVDGCGRIVRGEAPGYVIKWASCTFYGVRGPQSVWGYRVACLGCGAVDESPHGSSVSAEDGPPRFAWEHRDCAHA
jgi:hypothetical protein